MMNWEQEKAWRAKRAAALGTEMDQAIEAADKERFQDAFVKAMNYMKKKDRIAYYKRFLEKTMGRA